MAMMVIDGRRKTVTIQYLTFTTKHYKAVSVKSKYLTRYFVNAIIRRDYTSPIDTQIKIFDKKITIFNPGRLYGDMTIENKNR